MNVNAYSLWTALVTPLNPDKTLDCNGLSLLISEQQKIDTGLLLLGSTAESLNLGDDLRKQVLRQALSPSLQLPIMVGVPGHDLAATIVWLDYLESLPIDAYLMITPIYARAGHEGQYHWFKTLMDRVSRPVMLYNVPKRTGSPLSVKAVAQLCHHKNYWGIKDASGSLTIFREYQKASEGRAVFCGDDQMFPEFATAGSRGLVSVASNVWPCAVKRFVDQCLAGQFHDHALWMEALELLFQVTNPVAVKRILFEEGRIASKTLMPPLSEFDFDEVSSLHLMSKKIRAWTQQAK